MSVNPRVGFSTVRSTLQRKSLNMEQLFNLGNYPKCCYCQCNASFSERKKMKKQEKAALNAIQMPWQKIKEFFSILPGTALHPSCN